MKERYEIIKTVHPNYLVFFKKNGELITIGDTKEILKFFCFNKLQHVNYLIIDNLEIVEKVTYDDNRYDEYLSKAKLISLFTQFK